jgi:hypothetical protein
MHSIEVTLSDGTKGEVNATRVDRWSVGDEVVIKSKNESQYGLKLSLDKAGYGNGNSGGFSSPSRQGNARQDQIETQWAINASIEVNKGLGKDNLDREAIKEGAKALLEIRDEIINERKA